jgi:hypothetical protein
MNLRELLNLSDEQYGLLFDVRRSIRYHDRRKAFYDRLHHITSLLTILLAGSVLFDWAKDGNTAQWMLVLSTIAALLAALDMVIGYSNRANLHSSLRERFAALEIEMVTGESDDHEAWTNYQRQRLLIEKDEPATYQALNLLCHNEVLVAEGFSKSKTPEYFPKLYFWHSWTRNLLRWENITTA